MKDLKKLAKKYIENDYIPKSKSNSGYAHVSYNRIELLNHVKEIRQWIYDAYTVLYFLKSRTDRSESELFSEDHQRILGVMLNGVFANEPELFEPLDALEDKLEGNLDEDLASLVLSLYTFKSR